MPRFRVSTALGFVFVFLSPAGLIICAANAAQKSTLPPTPPNIRVAPVLTAIFDELLSVSPTFTAQCARIASAKYVHVIVNPVMASSTISRGTARTTMRRFSSGALLASVEMPVPLTSLEYAELFGHEFEHIIEQIDHVDLNALTLEGDGATRLSDGAYETARARKAGRAIADEAERTRADIDLSLRQGRPGTPVALPLRRP
jgi:hypothetical protein